MTASDQLGQYRAGFQDSRDRLHSLVGPLSDDAFNWKPGPRRWSVAECIVHLNKIGKNYVPPMADAVARLPPGAGPFRYGWVSRRFIEAVRPGSRAIPTPPAMKPPAAQGTQSAIDRERALAGLDRVTAQFVEIIEAGQDRDLGSARMASPFLPILRLPVGAFLEAMSLHALRHTGQAERVAAEPGFPR